jgi:hypothetical protein
MKTETKKLHVFAENPSEDGEQRTWSYGVHRRLTFKEVQQVKNLLPQDDEVLIIRFENPENYVYPGNTNSTITIDEDEQI